MFLSVGWPLLRAVGFFCNLDVLYGGLGIGKLQFLIQIFFFSAVIFFHFLIIKALDPEWIRIRIRIGIQPKMLDPDPDENECGSATLIADITSCPRGSRPTRVRSAGRE